ncbi:hypothetical protein A6E01_20145 (plasmid) [Vibrio breoganii]|uniref:DUF4148 domain-containing protein n=1 Tax=Vibrio breoganii TaxID=553239 RepID=A0AAN1CU99_9VIBR|nr:hypothetical protein [Vibrio breoganii]ANO35526.1 hypothetical protein A6E01_20145 [Vibrio breoganii]
MKSIYGVALVSLLVSPLVMAVDYDLEYSDVIAQVESSKNYDIVPEDEWSQGEGENYYVDDVDHASSVTTAAQALKVNSAERNAIISDARAGTVSSASYSTSSGNATRLSTSERNYLINQAVIEICKDFSHC